MFETETEIKTALLVMSQLFFTVFGSLLNVFLFIILRDLPDLSCSTYNVLILNLSFCNILSCTIVKPMASIFVSYAFTQVPNSIQYSSFNLGFRMSQKLQWSSVQSILFFTGPPYLSVLSQSSSCLGISSSAAGELIREH